MRTEHRERGQMAPADHRDGEGVAHPHLEAGLLQRPGEQQRRQEHGGHGEGVRPDLLPVARHRRHHREQEAGEHPGLRGEQPPPEQSEQSRGGGHGQGPGIRIAVGESPASETQKCIST